VPATLGPIVRPYQPGDLDAVYEVCVRTGDAGGDATGKYPNDDLLPDIFAGPYVHLEPELAFVVDDGRRAVGYVLGTADTERFVRSYRDEWLPTLQGKYPEPAGWPTGDGDWFLARLYRPEEMLLPEAARYPAHLHIDLLPPYQRAGYGRRLIEAFMEAAGKAGAPGVHLIVAGSNTGAHQFYQRVGFERVEAADLGGAILFVRTTSGQPTSPG
jgi:ribosomal protein S18 acetylase RimI-like enzyme